MRDAARIAGIPLWRIAMQAGISEPTLTRWLRVPLSEDRERRIVRAIEELKEEAR